MFKPLMTFVFKLRTLHLGVFLFPFVGSPWFSPSPASSRASSAAWPRSIRSCPHSPPPKKKQQILLEGDKYKGYSGKPSILLVHFGFFFYHKVHFLWTSNSWTFPWNQHLFSLPASAVNLRRGCNKSFQISHQLTHPELVTSSGCWETWRAPITSCQTHLPNC